MHFPRDTRWNNRPSGHGLWFVHGLLSVHGLLIRMYVFLLFSSQGRVSLYVYQCQARRLKDARVTMFLLGLFSYCTAVT